MPASLIRVDGAVRDVAGNVVPEVLTHRCEPQQVPIDGDREGGEALGGAGRERLDEEWMGPAFRMLRGMVCANRRAELTQPRRQWRAVQGYRSSSVACSTPWALKTPRWRAERASRSIGQRGRPPHAPSASIHNQPFGG